MLEEVYYFVKLFNTSVGTNLKFVYNYPKIDGSKMLGKKNQKVRKFYLLDLCLYSCGTGSIYRASDS